MVDERYEIEHKRVHDLEDELTKRQRKLAEYEEEVFRLREENNTLNAALDEVGTEPEELAKLREEVGHLRPERDALRDELTGLREENDLLKTTRIDYTELQAELATLREQRDEYAHRLVVQYDELAKLREREQRSFELGYAQAEAELAKWKRLYEKRTEQFDRLRGELIRSDNENIKFDSEIGKLREALETGRCPRCGEWFRDDPKTSNVLKETT